ncbi:MAG: RNA polymerase sigma factor [Dokdonella sp.]
MKSTELQRTIDAVWRIESPGLIGALARMLGDVGHAEECAQDALVSALEHWPRSGVPDNPGAWLMSTAKHRAIDRLRRERMLAQKHDQLAQSLNAETDDRASAREDAFDGDIGDDLLRLMFSACHPLLATDARVAMTLRLLGGLTTDEIARAFLVPEATIAQRIVRAKRTLTKAKVPFEVPRGEALEARLDSILEVIYLVFNEGYTATAGAEWVRPALCEDALRLGRILVGLMPKQPQVHGLIALIEIQASRLHARTRADGEPVLLLEQDRSRWDRLLIERGLAALRRAEELGGGFGHALQAAIAACHARAPRAEDTDWTRIAALYATLARVMPSPVIELNRAVAVSMARGAQAGLDLVDALRDAPALARYHLLPSVRGDLLFKLDRHAEARAEFKRAAALTRNARERALLLARAQACGVEPG